MVQQYIAHNADGGLRNALQAAARAASVSGKRARGSSGAAERVGHHNGATDHSFYLHGAAGAAHDKALYRQMQRFSKRHPDAGVSRRGVPLPPLEDGHDDLTAQQLSALESVLGGTSVFMTGPGGTGKTYAVRHLVTHLAAQSIQVQVTATTGVAALALEGVTLHSLLGLGMGKESTQHYVKRVSKLGRLRYALQGLHVLIIDEVSMLSAPLMRTVDAVLRAAREVDEPMGGLVVLALGDFLQLPPVMAKPATAWSAGGHDAVAAVAAAADASTPLFLSSVWQDVDFSTHLLTTSARHASDPQWNALLQRVRLGRPSAADFDLLRSRVVQNADVPHTASWLLPTRDAVAAVNAAAARKLKQPLVHLRPQLSALVQAGCPGSKPQWLDYGRVGKNVSAAVHAAVHGAQVLAHTAQPRIPAGVHNALPDSTPACVVNGALQALRSSLQRTEGVQLCVGMRVMLVRKLPRAPLRPQLVNGSTGTVLGWARCVPSYGGLLNEVPVDEQTQWGRATAAGRSKPSKADAMDLCVHCVDGLHVLPEDLKLSAMATLQPPTVNRVHAAVAEKLQLDMQRCTEPVHCFPSYMQMDCAQKPSRSSASGTDDGDSDEDDGPLSLEAKCAAVAKCFTVTPVRMSRDTCVMPRATVWDAVAQAYSDAAREGPLPSGDTEAAQTRKESVVRAALAECTSYVPIVAFDDGQTHLVPPMFFGTETELRGSSVEVRRTLSVGAWICPLIPAAAITVHKSQGASLDCVATALSNMQTAGQAYVALSRVRTLRGLHLTQFDPACLHADDTIVQWYETWEAAAMLQLDEESEGSCSDHGSSVDGDPVPSGDPVPNDSVCGSQGAAAGL